MRLLILLLMFLLSACSYTPSHQIPVHPRFIEAGVDPGDEIEVTTKDGRQLRFVVTEVSDDTLAGDDVLMPLADIESLFVRSWSAPEHPCGGGRPVGCSTPDVVAAIGEQLTDQFTASCIRHDYCYRHGHVTYGVDRETCDQRFHEDMQKECGSTGFLGILSFHDALEQAQCRALAASMHAAVRRYGEAAFLTTASTECPYDEPL